MPTTSVLDIPARVSQMTITIPTDRKNNQNIRFALDQQGIFYNVQEFDDVTHWSVPEDQFSRARTIIGQPGKYFGGLGLFGVIRPATAKLGFLAAPVAERIARRTVFGLGRRGMGMGAVSRVALLTPLPSGPVPAQAPSPAPVSSAPRAIRPVTRPRSTLGPGSTAGEIPMAPPSYDPNWARYYAQTTANVASNLIVRGPLSRYEDELARIERELRERMQERIRELVAMGYDPNYARDLAEREFEQAMAAERSRLQNLAAGESAAIVDVTAEAVGDKMATGELKPKSGFPWWILIVGAALL